MAGFVTASANKSEQEPAQKSPEAAAAAAVLAQKRQIRRKDSALRAERRIIRAQRLKEDQAWEAVRNQRRAEQAAQKAAQKAAQEATVESHHAAWDAPTVVPRATILSASSTDQSTCITIKTNNLPAESAPSIVKNSNLPVQHATAAGGAFCAQSATAAGSVADLPVESESSDKGSDSPAQSAIDKSSNLSSETTTFVTMSTDLVIKAVPDESTSATNRSSAQATEATIESTPQHSKEAVRAKETKSSFISEPEVKAKGPSISDSQWRQLKLQRRAQKEQRKQENFEWRQKRNSILQRLLVHLLPLGWPF